MSHYSPPKKRKRPGISLFANIFPDDRRAAERNHRFYAREHARYTALMARAANMPPTGVLIEQATLSCPRCHTSIGSIPFPNNEVMCPTYTAMWKIKVWMLPRKSGLPPLATFAAFTVRLENPHLLAADRSRISPPAQYRFYFNIQKGAFQCPHCAHLCHLSFVARNSFQCGRCKRHWEMLVRVLGLLQAQVAGTSQTAASWPPDGPAPLDFN